MTQVNKEKEKEAKEKEEAEEKAVKAAFAKHVVEVRSQKNIGFSADAKREKMVRCKICQESFPVEGRTTNITCPFCQKPFKVAFLGTVKGQFL